MKLSIDFDKGKATLRDFIIVCIKRNNKDNIIYNSGLLYFRYGVALERFISIVEGELDIIEVDPYEPVNLRERV